MAGVGLLVSSTQYQHPCSRRQLLGEGGKHGASPSVGESKGAGKMVSRNEHQNEVGFSAVCHAPCAMRHVPICHTTV